jgi:hypothetical protein
VRDAALDRPRSAPDVTRPTGPGRPQGVGDDREAPWWRRLVPWLVPVAVALPAVCAVVAALAHGWTPVGDQAGEVARIADVGTRHTPLVGPYSRAGWSHPGPLLFWACAPGWRLLGPAGVMATVGLLNAGAAALATVLARRVAGVAFSVAVAGALLAVELAIGPAGLVDVWNPYVGTIALATGLLASIAVVSGTDRALPVAVLALSWAVQAHVGPALTAATAVVAAVALLVVSRRVADRRWSAVAVVLGGLAWAGPVVDQLTGDPGNLRATVSGLAGSGGPRPGIGTSLGYAAGHLGLLPAWVQGGESPFRQGPVWTLAVPPAALALTGLTARRRGDRVVVVASVIMGASFVSAVATTTRIDLVVASYLYRWTWAVGALAWAVVALGAWRRLAGARADRPGRPARLRPGVAPLAVAVVVVAAVGVSVVGIGDEQGRVPVPTRSAAAAGLLGQLDGLPRAGSYVIVIQGVGWGTVAMGVGVGLIVAGHDVVFPGSFRHQLGAHRVVAGPERRQRLVVLAAPTFEEGPPGRGATLLATHDPLTRTERARVGALSRQVRAQVGMPSDQPIDAQGYGGVVLVAQGAERSTVDALAALTVRGERYTVWLVP